MTQAIIQIGNSAGIIFPQELRKALNLKVGDKITMEKKKNVIVVTPIKKQAIKGIDASFAKIVDEFIDEHEDVLAELANK